MSTHGSLSEVELFNLLYKSSFNKVCNFACFYVRNKQVSEDITGQRNNLRDFIFKHII